MNSVEAKKKFCFAINNKCVAEHCMMWVIQQYNDPIESVPANIVVDAGSVKLPQSLHNHYAVFIDKGKLFYEKFNLIHREKYDRVIEDIEWSEQVDKQVQKRSVPNIIEVERKEVFYDHNKKIWLEKIKHIESSEGYCAKYTKEYAI